MGGETASLPDLVILVIPHMCYSLSDRVTPGVELRRARVCILQEEIIWLEMSEK